MTELMEQVRMREYLRDKGDRLPLAEVRARVAEPSTYGGAPGAGSAAEAAGRPLPGEWSIHEVVDHLVLTHAPSVGEPRRPAGRTPARGPAHSRRAPIRGSPGAPLGRAAGALHAQHAAALRVLDGARDLPTEARAPVVAVVNVRGADGRAAPVHWEEEIAWKAYAVFAFRLHSLDHIGQIRKLLAAGSGRDGHPRGSRARPGGRGLSSVLGWPQATVEANSALAFRSSSGWARRSSAVMARVLAAATMPVCAMWGFRPTRRTRGSGRDTVGADADVRVNGRQGLAHIAAVGGSVARLDRRRGPRGSRSARGSA